MKITLPKNIARATLRYVLFLVGLLMMLHEEITITGSFIGDPLYSNAGSLLGLLLMLVVIFSRKNETIDKVVAELQGKLKEKRETHPGNAKYSRGLTEIGERIDHDIKNYEHTDSTWIKAKILDRLERWNEALERRDRFFFSLPHHTAGVSDLPDRGLYAYKPLEGKGTRYIELKVIHYTEHGAYKHIKHAFESGQDQVLFRDGAGWAYFMAESLPEGLSIVEARTILGTGLQDYVPFPKQRIRDPTSAITFKIRVPKERVMVREEVYGTRWGRKIKVTKYAIAGGIALKDIVQKEQPVGTLYSNKTKNQTRLKTESWNSRV